LTVVYSFAQPCGGDRLWRGDLAVGLASIATDLPAPATAKGLGGGDKIRWKLTVRTRADVELVLRHLGAAKG
jgi:hypothetical protein